MNLAGELEKACDFPGRDVSATMALKSTDRSGPWSLRCSLNLIACLFLQGHCKEAEELYQDIDLRVLDLSTDAGLRCDFTNLHEIRSLYLQDRTLNDATKANEETSSNAESRFIKGSRSSIRDKSWVKRMFRKTPSPLKDLKVTGQPQRLKSMTGQVGQVQSELRSQHSDYLGIAPRPLWQPRTESPLPILSPRFQAPPTKPIPSLPPNGSGRELLGSRSSLSPRNQPRTGSSHSCHNAAYVDTGYESSTAPSPVPSMQSKTENPSLTLRGRSPFEKEPRNSQSPTSSIPYSQGCSVLPLRSADPLQSRGIEDRELKDDWEGAIQTSRELSSRPFTIKLEDEVGQTPSAICCD